MNSWLLLAGVASGLTMLLHIFGGGRFFMAPVLSEQALAVYPKTIMYYCWHIVTIVLFFMSASFIYCAFYPAEPLAWIQTIQATLFCVWNVFLIVWKKLSPRRLIQWVLFLPIALFGFTGLL